MNKPWYEELFWALVSMMTSAGLGPESVTASGVLPTGYSREAEETILREKIVDFCRLELGKPYLMGAKEWASDPANTKEWDCSGLSKAAYEQAKLVLPDGAQQQYDETVEVRDPLPGDLGFLWSDTRGIIGHVMVRSGPGAVIHAHTDAGVTEDLAARWETHPRWRGWRRHHELAR